MSSPRVPIPCGLCGADSTLFYRREARPVWDGPARKEFAARCASHAGNRLNTDGQGDWTIGSYEDCVVADVMDV